MELYILKNLTDVDYDEVDGFVVQANNPAEARQVAADFAKEEGREVWLNPKYSSCKRLKPSGAHAAMIMRDYQAG